MKKKVEEVHSPPSSPSEESEEDVHDTKTPISLMRIRRDVAQHQGRRKYPLKLKRTRRPRKKRNKIFYKQTEDWVWELGWLDLFRALADPCCLDLRLNIFVLVHLSMHGIPLKLHIKRYSFRGEGCCLGSIQRDLHLVCWFQSFAASKHPLSIQIQLQ